MVSKETETIQMCIFSIRLKKDVSQLCALSTTAITRNTSNAGTLKYQQKESLLGKIPEPYMDMYAVGCIMMELFTCKCIWKDINNSGQLGAKIISSEYPCTDELKNHAVKEFVRIK